MNAPLPHQQFSDDGRDRLRDHIAETAGVLIAHAECLIRYTDIRDDAGVSYSVKHIVTYAKAIIGAHNQLSAVTRHMADGAEATENNSC